MNDTLGVEEFQGLYGPFQISELVLQKIWLKGAFDIEGMSDSRGRPVKVLFPGRWNRLAGPDFKDAILLIDGKRVEGDVEVHFSQSEWRGHAHHENPNFDRVVLHVIYHPVGPVERQTETASGKTIPTVSLMELLWYDLEEYASEDSIIESTGGSVEEAFSELFSLSIEQRKIRLMNAAQERWNVKRDFANLRIERLGWVEACHMTALEIMGYAANRIPMLHVAGTFPAARFRSERPRVAELWDAGREFWTTSGVRPANYPKTRLEQFIEWNVAHPDWQESLQELAVALPHGPMEKEATAKYRKKVGISRIQETFLDQLVGRQVGGSKLDTLVCDGFLPLLSAQSGIDFGGLWFHWYVGNAPDSLSKILKKLDVLETHRFPMSNGWVQGLLKIRNAVLANR